MKTSITKTFTYKLKPSKLVKQVFNQYAGSVRYIYNYMLALLKSHLETENKWLSYKHMASLLPILKRQENTQWLKLVHSQVLQQALKNLDTSITKYIRSRKNKQKTGFPRFKKKGIKDSFRYPQGIKITHDKVYLPKIGWIRYINTRPLEGKVKPVRFKKLYALEARSGYLVLLPRALVHVFAVAISADNRYLVSHVDHHTVAFWDIRTGQLIATFGGHCSVQSIALSADNKYMVSGSSDKTMRLWDFDFFTGTISLQRLLEVLRQA